MRIGPVPLIVLLVACASAGSDTAGDPQPTRSRAALATMSVDNRTTESLGIYYRLTAPPATEVRVGLVGAGAFAEMAPVPAGEALILFARTPAGAELLLPPRTFTLGSHWVWQIPADARFVRPTDGAAS
jgi:hypothetical protein